MTDSKGTPIARPADGGEETRAIHAEIEIDAPVDAVWEALADPRELERWFPLQARVEPGEGGSIWMSWGNEFEGDSKIVAWEEGRRLAITWMEEGIVADFTLEGRGGGTTVLRLVHSGFPTDASWDEWFGSTVRGWEFELQSLKTYLERHAGRDRRVVYLRRRVGLSHDEAWSRLVEAFGGVDARGPGERYEATAFDGRALAGRVLDLEPPRQWAGTVETMGDALLRLSTEPCHAPGDVRDATVFLSCWGAAGDGIASIEETWRERLEAIFPEGETV